MSRQARNSYPNCYYHIMSRGFKRELLFDDDDDYKYYIDCLEKYKNYNYKIIEYSLMPNHTHILLKTGDIPLQKILKSINTRYAIYKSRKRGLPGPIFQGRPKSILIIGEKHLKTVARYILRNPLKAKLIQNIKSYKWCSYKYLTNFVSPEWYDNKIIINSFNKNKKEAIKLYKEFILSKIKEDELDYPLECFSGIDAGTKVLYEKFLKKSFYNKRINKKTYTRKIKWNKRIEKIIFKYGNTIEKLILDQTKKTQSKQKEELRI